MKLSERTSNICDILVMSIKTSSLAVVVVNQWATFDCKGSQSSITNINAEDTKGTTAGNASGPFIF
jgi:hypothetical protein